MLRPVLLTMVLLETMASMVYVPGDFELGGLFPVHNMGKHAACGRINRNRGIQRLEAMLFAIDRINADPKLLNGFKLGAKILDTCSCAEYALNQSLGFVLGSGNTASRDAFECSNGATPTLRHGSETLRGVIGASHSDVSQAVASLLGLFRIPQVSPASTGISLSDKTRYSFFARSVPPDTFQATVIAEVLQRLNWTYVSLVTSEGLYGDSGMTAFHVEARRRNICVAVNEKVPRAAGDHHYDQIYNSLRLKSNARGVVLFTRAVDTLGVLAAAKRANGSGEFAWVASDGWGRQKNLLEGLEDVAEGAITVEVESPAVPAFDEYMKNLTVEGNRRNPWFREFWEDVFQCSTRKNENNSGLILLECSDDLRLHEAAGYRQEAKVPFVIDAVYAMAHALHDAWEDLCGSENGSYCQTLRTLDGGIFYRKYLLNVAFQGMSGTLVRFDEKGDRYAPYRIYNYQRMKNSSRYDYFPVGRWMDALELNLTAIRWAGSSEQPPQSVCSAPCGAGQIKLFQSGDTCCWVCHACQPGQYLIDDSTCGDCGEGRQPYPDKRGCFDVNLES